MSLTFSVSVPTGRCDWPDRTRAQQRSDFCDKYEGFGGLCNCSDPDPLDRPFRPVCRSDWGGATLSLSSIDCHLYIYSVKILLHTYGTLFMKL